VYSTALGIRNGRKIAWVRLSDQDGRNPQWPLYDIERSDEALFDSGLWTEMAGEWMLWGWLIPAIAIDDDTPRDVLLRITDRLQTYISAYTAWQLLRNRRIMDEEEVLAVLACLPVFRGDAYELPRARARELLGRTFSGCGD